MAKAHRREWYDAYIEALAEYGLRQKDIPPYDAIVTGVVDLIDCVGALSFWTVPNSIKARLRRLVQIA